MTFDTGYYETQRERNDISRSVKAETKNGLRQPLPTKAEYDAKCGEVHSYNLNKPLQWKQFKTYPRDIQREYIESLMRKYKATYTMIARMFGVSDHTVGNLAYSLGIKAGPKAKPPKSALEEWNLFVSHPHEKPEVKTQEKPCVIEEKPCVTVETQCKPKPMAVLSGSITIEGEVVQVCEWIYKMVGHGKIKCAVEFGQ